MTGHRPRGRRGSSAAASAAVALAVAGSALVAVGVQGGGPPQPAAAAAPAAPAPAAAPAAPTAPSTGAGDRTADSEPSGVVGPTMSRSRPVGLEIPAIGLRAGRLVDLGQEDDGTLEVPEDYDLAGWYELGSAPGQLGPAVIAGHVDNEDGPAVFYRLGELERGDEVRVPRKDGRTARFVVDRVERYPKDEFPTVEVYGDTTGRAELRLITCGGRFDERTGHYVDNVVVFAHLV